MMARWRFALSLLPGGGLRRETDEVSTRRPVEAVAATPWIFDGAFHLVVATRATACRCAVDVDGHRLVTVPSRGGTLNDAMTTPLRLGGGGHGAASFFKGVLDEPMVWGRALTASEIGSAYLTGPSSMCALGEVPPGEGADGAAPECHGDGRVLGSLAPEPSSVIASFASKTGTSPTVAVDFMDRTGTWRTSRRTWTGCWIRGRRG